MKKYKHSIDVGLSFGLTSGVITTIGLMVGVYSGTESTTAVLSSIVTIAVADAMSDALGIHIAEESENVHTAKEIWVATLTTFLAKFLVSASFIIPLLLFSLKTAVFVNIGYGTLLMVGYNYIIGIKQQRNTFSIILEHLLIAVVVVICAYFLGQWINLNFTK